MEVILLERVAKLGQMGEVVKVRDGFARNFLIPQKKALRATEANKQIFEIRRAEIEKVPYTLVLGQKEAEAKAVSVRSRARGDEGVQPFAEYMERLVQEIRTRALPAKKV